MSLEEARSKDSQYPVYADKFEVPTFGSLGIDNVAVDKTSNCIYFCGNSLGLMPKATRKAINDELDAWSARGVESHFNHSGEKAGLTSWVDIDLPLVPLLSPLVGAKETEVAAMGSLTSNLNALLISFYKPKGKKCKILFEKQAFPSDYYAFANLVKLFGYDESQLIQLSVKEGQTYLLTEDILEAIESNKDELALVCFPGIQYYTGQLFDIKTITQYAHDRDITVGWDLAHAIGNVPLCLHDWGVDFAAWCSYKYLNSGPGAIAGIFVHEKHTKNNSKEAFPPRLAGWWGNNASDRFKMLEVYDPINSALSYRQSNPSVIDVVALQASLKLFKEVGGVDALRKKSLALTQYLQDLITASEFYVGKDDATKKVGYKILTPLSPEERGAQLSVLFTSNDVMEHVFKTLHDSGIIVDERRPNVIRFAPLPLYNTFVEVWQVNQKLQEALKSF